MSEVSDKVKGLFLPLLAGRGWVPVATLRGAIPDGVADEVEFTSPLAYEDAGKLDAGRHKVSQAVVEELVESEVCESRRCNGGGEEIRLIAEPPATRQALSGEGPPDVNLSLVPTGSVGASASPPGDDGNVPVLARDGVVETPSPTPPAGDSDYPLHENEAVTPVKAPTSGARSEENQESAGGDVAVCGRSGGSELYDGSLLDPGPFGPPVIATSPFDLATQEAHARKIVDGMRLLIAPGQVVELRVLDAVSESYRRPHVVSGFFGYDHLEEMARHALKWSSSAKGVYFTMNPLKPDLLSRRFNRVDDAKDEELAADKDVLKRNWLLVDVDPRRLTGVSATDLEKDKARQTILRIRDHLNGLGWPVPLLADSGNGWHLLYPVDLPADDGGLLKRVLQALADRFDDAHVEVDRKVHNPSRIVKLYGTLARKGDDTPERPHRWSYLVQGPQQLVLVSREQLEALAAQSSENKEERTTAVTVETPQGLDAIQERARRYLEKVPPAVAGNHGHDQAFRAACVLVQQFGLTEEKALPVLKHYNRKCEPPWSEQELLHKLKDAAKKDGPRGDLLSPARGGSHQVLGGFRADFLDSAALDATAVQHRWLVKKILVADQLVLVGGPKKALKTSIAIDLAISLGTGKPFLGKFETPKPAKVLMLSGESGMGAIRETARRVAQAKGIDFRACDVLWGFQLPRLSYSEDLDVLTQSLGEQGIEVVLIDPLYLCLLAGNVEGRQASNLYDMGPLLLNVAQACLDAGATPILVHHTRKQSQAIKGRDGEPLDLEDLAYAGVAEFARQWLLLSRREPFDPDSGAHKLWLRVGGSAGHAGLYGLDVREGVLNDAFGGRQWQVTVQPAAKAIQASAKAKEEKRQQTKLMKETADKEKVVEALKGFTVGSTTPDLARAAGLGKGKALRILTELLQDGCVFQTRVQKRFGNGKKDQPGWLLWRRQDRVFSNEEMRRLRNGDFVEDVLGVEAVDGFGKPVAPGVEE